MTRRLDNTGNAGTPNNDAMCSSAGAGQTMKTREVNDGGTGTSTEQVKINVTDTNKHLLHLSTPANVPNETSWPASSGTDPTQIDISIGNIDIDIISGDVCRMNSAEVNQATVGSVTGLSITCSAGLKTLNIAWAAQTAAATDRIYVVISCDSTIGGHGNHGWTARDTDTFVESPLAAFAGFEPGILRRYEGGVPAPSINLRM